ncbi:glycine-rich RNA-binding, abscisic acid-inducible protein-like [Arachis stenosperma]|uniref:glycine-rich RNA-binding, abscisic acid-inducible protein-like n=1 Tax=Arachis stenosperma TaxID=217475 RepID=UPI0025AC2EB1|nr:glycine-rich RNA-binding, abscisic acid-inducible protein-like [Arachis stenosperma]
MAATDVEFWCFVGGLAWATNNEALEKAFSAYGEIVESKISYDRKIGRSRGFRFVTFAFEQAMKDAIDGMNGSNLDGHNITVNEAQSRGGGGVFRSRGGGGGGGGFRSRRGGGYGGGGFSRDGNGGGYERRDRHEGGYNRNDGGGGGYREKNAVIVTVREGVATDSGDAANDAVEEGDVDDEADPIFILSKDAVVVEESFTAELNDELEALLEKKINP